MSSSQQTNVRFEVKINRVENFDCYFGKKNPKSKFFMNSINLCGFNMGIKCRKMKREKTKNYTVGCHSTDPDSKTYLAIRKLSGKSNFGKK